jgi:hypothetical protein
MSFRTLEFSFSDLEVDIPGIHAVLGFPGQELPDPFNEYLAEALGFAAGLSEIRAAWLLEDHAVLDAARGTLRVDRITFETGKTLCKELRGTEKVLFFVCTAGKSVGERSSALLRGEDPAKGYIYDQLGTFLTEAAAEKMQQLFQREMAGSGLKITNRYSPGYCQWPVSDQHKLFSLFPEAPCGVTLTGSALMNPVKSASGLIGIGSGVKYRDYPCELCSSVQCMYRKIPAKE